MLNASKTADDIAAEAYADAARGGPLRERPGSPFAPTTRREEIEQGHARVQTVVADGGGLRFPDEGKLARFDLLPPEAQLELASYMGRNSDEHGGPYPSRNWERGMKWSHCFGAILRHAWKYWRGERYDKKTGTHHMICIMWNAQAIFTYDVRGIGVDDRNVTPAVRPSWEKPEGSA